MLFSYDKTRITSSRGNVSSFYSELDIMCPVMILLILTVTDIETNGRRNVNMSIS